MIKRDDVLWMAGYLEGEGSFSSRKIGRLLRGKPYPEPLPKYPIFSVMSTDKDVVEKVSTLTGFAVQSVKPKPNCKPLYRCVASGPNARGWMMMIYPFMGERRKARIKSVLAAWRAQ